MDWIFRQEALFKKKTGVDGWNKPTYADPVKIKCRCQFKWKLIKDSQGKEVMSRAQFWVPPDLVVKPEDLLVYKDEDHRVITTGGAVTLAGTTEHLKAWC